MIALSVKKISFVLAFLMYFVFTMQTLWADGIFLSDDMKKTLSVTVIEGRILNISAMPDPAENDYPDCLYCVELAVESCQDKNIKIAKNIILTIPIMKDKKILTKNKLQLNDKIQAKIASYETLPWKIQEIQMIDDIQAFETPYYYPVTLQKITDYSTDFHAVNEQKHEIIISQTENLPPVADSIKHARKKRIISEIKKVEEQLSAHEGSFAKWQKKYYTSLEEYRKLIKDGFSTWEKDCFFAALPYQYFDKKKTANFIANLLPYKKYLEERNIDLILLRIPTKGDFATAVLSHQSINPYWLETYYELLQNDIEVIDPLPAMYQNRYEYPLFYFFHIPRENHPFEGTSMIAAQELAAVLKRYGTEKSSNLFVMSEARYPDRKVVDRHNYPSGSARYPESEKMRFKAVQIQGGKDLTISPDTESPYLFCSNSFGAYPSKALGGSIPHYTAFFTKIEPAWFYQDGIGIGMLKTLITRPALLSNRRVVILVMHPNMWSEVIPAIPEVYQKKISRLVPQKIVAANAPEVSCRAAKQNSIHISNGSLAFTHEAQGGCISIKLDPVQNNFQGYMVRVNFKSNGFLRIKAILGDDNHQKAGDFIEISPSRTKSFVDFYLTGVGDKCQIILESVTKTQIKNEIENFEIWSY